MSRSNPARQLPLIIPGHWIPFLADWVKGRIEGRERQRIKDVTTGGANYHHKDRAHENIVGVVGELGVAWVYDVLVRKFRADRNSDDGRDLLIGTQWIDVKAGKELPSYLPVKDSGLAYLPGADLYIMTYCPLDGPTGWMCGWCTKDFVLRKGRHVPNVMNPNDAHPKDQQPGMVVSVNDLAWMDTFTAGPLVRREWYGLRA